MTVVFFSLLILFFVLIFVSLETKHFNHKKKQIQSKDGMDKSISEKLLLNFALRSGFIHSLLYIDKGE